MARRQQATLAFEALSIEGGLLPAEWIAKIASPEDTASTRAEYGVAKGLAFGDEIGRAWRIAQALWAEFEAARQTAGHHAEGVTVRFIEQILRDILGFGDIGSAVREERDGRQFVLTYAMQGGRVPVVVAPHPEGLDQSGTRFADGTRRRSAFGALQEYLNATDTALWGIATNGTTLRLARDNASLTRPAWIAVDCERLFREARYADFAAWWLLMHASRFGRPEQPVHECPLEQWRTNALEVGSRARRDLSRGVKDALAALGQGFLSHPANRPLRDALATGTLTDLGYYNELLRLVYRMIFLLTLEERGLLHPEEVDDETRTLYESGYGLRRLRERAVRRSQYDRHGDLWASLQPVFAGLGRAGGEPTLGLPGLGGLFAPTQCPHLDAAALDNRSLMRALYAMAWLRGEGGALVRVNWRDMGPEELGSVYESLLELVPVIENGGRDFRYANDEQSAGNERKTSGSYYTPDVLVQQLLDTALEPVIVDRLSAVPAGDGDAAFHALLSITVVDPACGSGHFLLGAARRLASHLARLRAGGTPTPAEYRLALRDVITHCIHGVDRNPMAIELARMALWLEAHTPDRPLGFIDHHLICGDALLGLLDLDVLAKGIPDEAFKALTGDNKDVSKILVKLNREARRALESEAKQGQLQLGLGTESLAGQFATLDALGDDDLAEVEAKRARYEALRAEADQARAALAADLYVGAFLVPKQLAPGEAAPTTQEVAGRLPTSASVRMALEGTLSDGHPVAATARQVCADARVLHWPLTFPQVFGRGGFDVVIGNPPWERIKLQEQEFFAQRAPQVATARNKAEREREIVKLRDAAPGTPERAVYDEFTRAKQLAEAASVFCHAEARYPLTGVGDVNTYALFAESMYRIAGVGGRVGVLLPIGIATDDSTKRFFAALVEERRLYSLLSCFEIRRWFPATDDRTSFCLFSIGAAPAAELAFHLDSEADFRDARRRFRLTSSDFQLINPNTRTCPIFRTADDAELTKKIYRRVPVLIDESREGPAANPWNVSFMRMLDMANDSGLFDNAPAVRALPLYEAKMIHQFDHRWATYDAPRAGAAPESRALTGAERADSIFSVRPRYWVDGGEVAERLDARGWTRDWLMGWRDICRATDERTTIAGIMPRVGVGHTMPLLIAPDREPSEMACLMANLNALVLDYVARQKVGGTHLTYGFLKQFPVLAPEMYGVAAHEFVVPRVLELTYTACDLLPWARDLGHDGPPSRWDPNRRALVRAELDAWYAHAYGLTRYELRYVLDPADVMGPDWPSETFRVLKNNEKRQFGEYRTRRLVLEAWDRLFGG